jgi:predicted signal transduction protein with EAL and GGDEF domain
VLHEHDIVARFLGDEFAVAGPVEDLAVTRQFGEKLVEVLCAPYMLEGQLVSLGVHIGAACAPLHGSAAEALAANAALALGEARTARSSLCIFDPAMVERATLRRALEIDLRQALQNQEFELFYQPQVDVHRNCVTGMEGLIRWRSPSRGLVPPIQFIPVAEQMGLICDIGAWVLRAACLEARHWPEAVTVAVNASPLQFESGDFAAQVERALAESGLSPHRLEIEITENLLLRDTGTVVATLDALHRLGVRLVLDDFGTGYASLSQLSRFNFDKIKIDRSFISPDEASTQNSAIVRSIAALGHSLGIPTTAEGVETARQLEQIKADGCTSVQGYFYSRPVPACEVDTLMERLHRPREQQAAA